MYKIIGADQKEYGPVSADQIRQWIAEGRVNALTRVQLAGSAEWTTVGAMPEFAAAVPPSAPAIPPVPGPIQPGPIHYHQPPRRNNPLAVWALVTGILSLLCCGFLAPVSIILGSIALAQARQHPEEGGTGMAVAGIVLGVLTILVWIILGAIVAANPDIWRNMTSQMQST